MFSAVSIARSGLAGPSGSARYDQLGAITRKRKYRENVKCSTTAITTNWTTAVYLRDTSKCSGAESSNRESGMIPSCSNDTASLAESGGTAARAEGGGMNGLVDSNHDRCSARLFVDMCLAPPLDQSSRGYLRRCGSYHHPCIKRRWCGVTVLKCASLKWRSRHPSSRREITWTIDRNSLSHHSQEINHTRLLVGPTHQ